MSLEINVLGGFAVVVDGVEVPAGAWTLRSARQLVKLLAVTPRHRLHREQLIEALWPHLEVRSATNELNKALHAARRVLEPLLEPRASSRFLLTADRTVALSVVELERVDADEFERVAKAALRSRDGRTVEAALDGYSGDLLPDDLYDDWASERRVELQALQARLELRASETGVEFKPAPVRIQVSRSADRVRRYHSELERRMVGSDRRSRRFGTTAWSRTVAALCCVLLGVGLTVQMVGASPKARHRIGRFLARTTALFEGRPSADSRLVTLKGKVPIPGTRVDAVDSVSGWAAIADASGLFSLIDVEARDDDQYDLIISDSLPARLVQVRSQGQTNDEEVLELGLIDIGSAREIDAAEAFGINSVSTLATNDTDWAYLAGVFDAVTAGTSGDDSRLAAVSAFVFARYSPVGAAEADQSQRTTIDVGSSQSGPLARLMGAMCAAVGYEVRLLEIVDASRGRKSHTIVEVKYGSGWHAYDPAFGIAARNGLGEIASYDELRQNPGLLDSAAYRQFHRPGWDGARIPELFASGIRRDSYFQNSSKVTPGPAIRPG